MLLFVVVLVASADLRVSLESIVGFLVSFWVLLFFCSLVVVVVLLDFMDPSWIDFPNLDIPC